MCMGAKCMYLRSVEHHTRIKRVVNFTYELFYRSGKFPLVFGRTSMRPLLTCDEDKIPCTCPQLNHWGLQYSIVTTEKKSCGNVNYEGRSECNASHLFPWKLQ